MSVSIAGDLLFVAEPVTWERRECDAETGETAPLGRSFGSGSFPGSTDSSVLC